LNSILHYIFHFFFSFRLPSRTIARDIPAMPTGPISNARTPQFGVCMDKGTRTTDRCVVSQASCDSDTEYYKAPYETTAICNSPDIVEIGRCTSDLDDKRCAPSESACGTKSPFFESFDPTCSLVKATSDGRRTTFPACSDEDNDVYQCVLDKNDCFLTEKLDYAKWASEWGPHECNCEDVPTGVCYEPQTGISGKLTAENSFCAVTARDCPDTHFWMSARDFLSSERASYECRLCDENKTGTSSPSYPAGACLDSGESATSFIPSSFLSCALEYHLCPPGSSGFVSAQRLQEAGLTCPIERTDNWGVCGSSGDPVECTNKSDSCRYDFRFERNSAECDIHGHSRTALPTYFSFCSPKIDNDDRDWKDVRCVWDISECDPTTERWEEARLPCGGWFEGCTCENVYTGVCKEPSTEEYHCAVSALGCTDPVSYVPQRMLKERGIDMECQLCVPRASTAVFPPTDAPVATVAPEPSISLVGVVPQPTLPPVTAFRPTLPPWPLPTLAPAPTNWPTLNTVSLNSSNGQKSLSHGAVIGMAVGAAVFCAILVWIITMFTGGGTMKEPQVSRTKNAIDDPEVDVGDLNHEEEPVPSTASII